MSRRVRRPPGASSAPSSIHPRQVIRSCIAAFIAGACVAASAADDTAAIEMPVQERVPDAPPPGVVLAPGLTFSGYGTVQFLAPDRRGRTQPAPGPGLGMRAPDEGEPQYSRRARLDLSHLSGIAWWEPSPSWKVLAEVDLQDVVQLPAHTADDDGPDSAPYAALDRLYADYRVNDAITVRGGKFLTPIGRWNQAHSDPQVWTVLRPLISQSAFPTNATGLMVFGSVPVGTQWIDYQTYAAPGGDWRPEPGTHPFRHAFGGRVSTALNPDLQVGVSLSRYVEQDYASTNFDLVGMDASWTWHRLEFSGEGVARRGIGNARTDEHGWFAQAVAPLIDRWWAVARIEAYRRAVEPAQSRTQLLGVVYRSGRHWVFKAEWARASGGGTDGLPSGLLSSITLVY